jgi:hypothetical protein
MQPWSVRSDIPTFAWNTSGALPLRPPARHDRDVATIANKRHQDVCGSEIVVKR